MPARQAARGPPRKDQAPLRRIPCGVETVTFAVEGSGEVDPNEDELGAGVPRAETTYRATDDGKAKVSVDLLYSRGPDPELRAISDSVEIEVAAKGEIEYRVAASFTNRQLFLTYIFSGKGLASSRLELPSEPGR